MSDTVKQKKRWFLKAELAVLVCVICVWIAKSELIDIGNVKAEVPERVVKVNPHSQAIAKNNPQQGDMPLIGTRKEFLRQQEEYKLRNFDMALANLDEYVAKERQNIEAWYIKELANLQQWEKERLEQLDREEKMAWARYNQNLKAVTSTTSGFLIVDNYGTASTYMMTDNYAMTNSYKATDGLHSQTTNTYVVGNPSGIYESEMLRIKNSKDAIKREFVKLQQQKERYLAELESNVYRQIGVINANKRYVQKNTRVKLQGGPGLIDAIVTNANGESLIMIEGEIFHDGDLVKGFKIKKIDGRTVEFQKDGQTWVQHMD